MLESVEGNAEWYQSSWSVVWKAEWYSSECWSVVGNAEW